MLLDFKALMECTHSIMFHHFHGGNHLPAQGSLNSNDFSRMLNWLEENFNLIGAHEYYEKFNLGNLTKQDVCLSFDDALLCQYDIAIPILKQRNLDAFFFIYSSVFTGNPDPLELYRYFRTNCFDSMDQFYKQFFNAVKVFNIELFIESKLKFDQIDYLRDFPFYTENDRWFRYLRDQALGPTVYAKLMDQLMYDKKFDIDGIISNLWISESNVKEIADLGHVVGLHSYSHPTQMSKLHYDDQFNEYFKNYEHLKGLTGDVYCMSHPCGDYNSDTLDILDYLGIKMGFNSSLRNGKVKSRFEIPRDDHANIFRLMR